MKLLLVFPFFPYPPTDGGRIGFFNPVKYLSRSHEITVVCLATHDEDLDVGELKRYCSEVYIYRYSRNLGSYRLVQGLFSSPPGSAAKYWHPCAGDLIKQAVAAHNPDIVEFHHLNTAVYRRFAGTVPTVLREHNIEYKVWERFARETYGLGNRMYSAWSGPRVKHYEAEICKQFDRCVVVSPADAAHLREVSPAARIEVIPSGVDTEYFLPAPDVPEQPLSITLTGSFAWQPKQRSLKSLLTQVFPKIRTSLPEARLFVVGKGVPKELLETAEAIPGVVVVGPVPDVRPYIARSALMINYLESGGGIALKILEAMAMHKPVLCNSMGCEGIPATHGKEIFVADGADEFAAAAICLLGNEGMRARLAENGYRRVREQYSWNHVASRFLECYETLLGEHQSQRCMTAYAKRP